MRYRFSRMFFFITALLSAACAPCFAQIQSPNSAKQAMPLGSKAYPFLGNLSVDIEEPYPEGYRPIWSFPVGINNIDVDYSANFGGNVFRRNERLPAGLFADPSTGRILFAWQGAVGKVCSALLAGTEGPIKLVSTPRSFKLTEISIHNDPGPCRQASTYVQNWSGQVNLSTDSSGNVTMVFVLDAYGSNGVHTLRNISVPYRFQNKMTPLMAAADVANKASAKAEEIRLLGNLNSRPSSSEAQTTATGPGRQPSEQLASEVEIERRKRQELEQSLAAAETRERERLAAEARERERPSAPPPTAAPTVRVAHALVIGNAAYPGSGRLDNPVNDATAISQKLRAMGFIVTTVTDANRQRLVQAMSQFRRTAASADVSLLFYSGHGVQVFGKNYMLPTDVDQTDMAQATIQGVSLNEVVENFLPGKTKLVFLDACRDNPLQRTGDRSVSRGLAPIAVAEGTLIAYATKDGQVASDGTGQRNSPFTQALLEHLSDPSDIAVVLRKVREKVMRATGGKQQPWEYGSLTGGELVLSAIRPAETRR